jgi:hypothetical protein
MSVRSSGTEHKSQNYGMHQSRRWCFNRMAASLGDFVMTSVLAIKPKREFPRTQRRGARARMDCDVQTKR